MIPVDVMTMHNRSTRDFADELRRYADDMAELCQALNYDPTLDDHEYAEFTRQLQSEIRVNNHNASKIAQGRSKLRFATFIHKMHDPQRLDHEGFEWPESV